MEGTSWIFDCIGSSNIAANFSMKEAHFDMVCAKLKNLEAAVQGHNFSKEQMQVLGRLVQRFADKANTAYSTRPTFADLSRIK